MKAKKLLGQHFLKSQMAIHSMVLSGNVSSKDTVLEIGPGKGILTKALLEKAGNVIAVEKDRELVLYLKKIFAEEIQSKKLQLIHADILKTSIPHTLNATAYKLIANIPYYITGEILERFLSIKHKPSSITLLLQKEVARRIVARDKKESVLSISVKVYGNPRYIKTVSKKYFTPQPKVDSAILHIENIKNPFKNLSEEKLFFTIVKRGFAHKRKLLKNNLSCGEKTLTVCDIVFKTRAENLSLKQWLCLSAQKI